ncbi:MAG: hypothetical protein MJA84_10840, partial [Firmicutes bacterium]|nr:hypothetical protein [Bacillota bacterium]
MSGRLHSFTRRRPAGLLLAGVIVVAGCQSAKAPETTQAFSPSTPPQQTTNHTIRNTARSLAERFAALRHNPSTQPPEILWLDDEVERDHQATRPSRLDIQPAVKPTPHAAQAPLNLVPQADSPPESTPVVTRSRRAMLAELLADVRQSDDPALSRALIAASLSLAETNQELDYSFVEPLSPEQRQTVQRYHALLLALHAQLAAGSRSVDRRALTDQIDELLADQPIEIVKLKLCRRVSGFGVYDPFDSTVFLAGRAQKMIGYLEFENYTALPGENHRYTVNLKQELELYDADGLMVWRHEPVSISDESTNRRRDFFTVQMITLPARLTVGKFHLKARVIDEHTGNRWESSMPIEIV